MGAGRGRDWGLPGGAEQAIAADGGAGAWRAGNPARNVTAANRDAPTPASRSSPVARFNRGAPTPVSRSSPVARFNRGAHTPASRSSPVGKNLQGDPRSPVLLQNRASRRIAAPPGRRCLCRDTSAAKSRCAATLSGRVTWPVASPGAPAAPTPAPRSPAAASRQTRPPTTRSARRRRGGGPKRSPDRGAASSPRPAPPPTFPARDRRI